MSALRVLMVHNEYARPSGEEHAAGAIAQLLQDRGHEVAWLKKSSAGLEDSAAGKIGAFFSGIHSPSARAEMSAVLDRLAFDVVHVQNLYPLLSPSILKPVYERGIPLVMRCPNYRMFCPTGLHLSRGQVCEKCLGGKEWQCVANNCGGSITKSVGYALRTAAARWSRSIVDHVTTFIVLSEFQKQRFAASGIPPEKIAVVPNPADPPPAAPWELGRNISFVGRVSPEKGIGQLLAAARRLPDYPFAIAGDLTACPEIKDQAPPNVEFHGFLSGEALERFYRRSRVLAFPSQWFEGFPNVILKAMTLGKPVITSRIGGLPEIVLDGHTGLLHEPASVDELASQIRRLYDNPDLCRAMGSGGRQRVLDHYSRDACYGRLMAVYDQARRAIQGRSTADRRADEQAESPQRQQAA